MSDVSVILNEESARKFEYFCKHEQEIVQIINSGFLNVVNSTVNWRELHDFATNRLQYGTVSVTFKDGAPVKVDNPIQSFVLGIVRA